MQELEKYRDVQSLYNFLAVLAYIRNTMSNQILSERSDGTVDPVCDGIRRVVTTRMIVDHDV